MTGGTALVIRGGIQEGEGAEIGADEIIEGGVTDENECRRESKRSESVVEVRNFV